MTDPATQSAATPESIRPWFRKADWIALGLLILAAVVVRVVYVVQSLDWPYFDVPLSDASLYVDRARGLLGGYWPAPNMAHSQAPLYPYLLAPVLAVADSHRPLLFVQMGVGCLTLAMVYLIARRAGSWPAAALAGLLCLGYGPLLAVEGKLLNESIATCLSLLAVYALIRQVDRTRWVWLVVAGLALGLDSCMKPSFMLAVPLAGVWLLWRRRAAGPRALPPALALCVTAAIPIAPFTWHNVRAEGAFIPISSAGGITFFLGNNPTAAGTLSFGGVITGGVGTQNEEQLARAEAVLGRRLTSAEASQFWYKRGLRFIQAHPRWWAWIMWRKLRLHVSSEEVANVYAFAVERTVIPVLRVLAVPFGVIGAFGLVGLVLTVRRDEAVPILILLGAGVATCMVFYTSSRFRMPTVPLMAVLAGWGVECAVAWWSAGEKRRALLSALAAGTLTVLMLWPVGEPLPSPELFGRRNLATMLSRVGQPDRAREMLRGQLEPGVNPDDRSEAYLSLGRIEFHAGQHRRAIEALEQALEIDPRNVAPYSDLAKCYYALGRHAEAVEHARKLLEKNPRDLECRGLVGQCFMKQKRWPQALAEFERAAQLSPDNPGVLYMLGQVQAKLHQYDKAVETFRRSLARRRDPRATVDLAFCLSRIDRKDEARRVLLGVLAANPEDARARALLRQLGGLTPR